MNVIQLSFWNNKEVKCYTCGKNIYLPIADTFLENRCRAFCSKKCVLNASESLSSSYVHVGLNIYVRFTVLFCEHSRGYLCSNSVKSVPQPIYSEIKTGIGCLFTCVNCAQEKIYVSPELSCGCKEYRGGDINIARKIASKINNDIKKLASAGIILQKNNTTSYKYKSPIKN